MNVNEHEAKNNV